MKQGIYICLSVFASITFLLSLPYVVGFVQARVADNNIPTNPIIDNQSFVETVLKGKKASTIPKERGLPAPALTATSALVTDVDSNYALYVKDPDKRVPIASTTKIMTALIASDFYRPENVIKVASISAMPGSTMDLKAGESLTFRSLLYGMLLNSGNDAAFALADNYPGGREAFVGAMNQKAKDLGLVNTHFENPAGFDNLSHYSSAADLSKITYLALKSFQISKIVATKSTTVTSIDQTEVHNLKNLNILLDQEGFIGVKTGFTPQAKENLIGLYQMGDRKVLTVVLGSDDRFGETQALIQWVTVNFDWN